MIQTFKILMSVTFFLRIFLSLPDVLTFYYFINASFAEFLAFFNKFADGQKLTLNLCQCIFQPPPSNLLLSLNGKSAA